MDDCIFCKIIKGDIPCKKIYEDENVLAFMDINPKAKGHTLVVPKNHSEGIYDIDEKDLENTIKVVKKLATEINEKLKPDGMNIRQNNGELAGQSVFHLHFHIVPKYAVEEEYDIEEIFNLLKS